MKALKTDEKLEEGSSLVQQQQREAKQIQSVH